MPTPNAPGFYPFWFWNDCLDEAEIRWQVAEMADKGIKGFFIHPRQGLQQPYLSDAFFDMVGVAIEAAEKRGLFVHLYDEYPYPSGVAGGEVTEGNPQFQATRLVQRTYDIDGGHTRLSLPRGQVLCCVACPMENNRPDWHRAIDLRSSVGMVLADESYNVAGLTAYNQKRYFASNPTPVLETVLPDGPFRVFASIQAHITTHKYWGYYTDVLNPDAVQHYIRLTHERYYARFGDRFGTTIRSIFVDETLPGWSARLPDAFRAEYGEDLLPLLPALQDDAHPEHVRIVRDLRGLRYKLFVAAYDQPMAAWCAQHGIAYSGEKGSLRLSQLRYMDIPGCDPGHTKAGAGALDNLTGNARRSARATVSAAYFYGKEGALDECYHSLGWSGTLQDAKFIADTLILQGVQYLVPHGFFYSTHALKKHDAPPTFFFQMPYWPHWRRLSAHVEKLYAELEGTHIDADILLVDRDTVLPDRADAETDDAIRTLLMASHLDFLIVDTDILESGRIEGGRAHIRDIAAKLVIVPPGRFVERPLADWLADFERRGGRVLRVDAGQDVEGLRARILDIVQPHLRVQVISGDAAKLQVVTRTNGRRTLWFLVNTGWESLHLVFDRSVRERALDGPPQFEGGEGWLAPFASALIEAVERPDVPLPRVSARIQGKMKVVPQNKNLVRLSSWEMSLLNEAGAVLQTETVPAIPMANQLAHGRFRFAPNIEMSFGVMPRFEMPVLRACYAHTFLNACADSVELVMEPGSIAGDWHIRVNDGDPIRASDFSQTDAHVRGSLGVDITRHLIQGVNCLTVDLVTGRMDGGLRNPLYLAGDFGVQCRPLCLTGRLHEGGFETYEANGLPFYAGMVTYETHFALDALPEVDEVLLDLDFGMRFLEACEISINHGDWQPCLWSPYAVVAPRRTLVPGLNALHVRVYTSLIRSFEGQRFDHEAHRYVDIG